MSIGLRKGSRRYHPASPKQVAQRELAWVSAQMRGVYWRIGSFGLASDAVQRFRGVLDARMVELGLETETARQAARGKDWAS